MAIQKCGLNLNRACKELRPHGTFDFPCAAYSAVYSDRPEEAIPWHWHEELEIAFVRDGRMELQIPGEIYVLERGDCVVINSNILHCAAALPRCELQSLVFHPALVTGTKDSVFSTKYVLPLLSQTSFKGYVLREEENRAQTENFTGAFLALAEEIPGFEFTVRENLSRLCYFLFRQFEHEISVGEAAYNQDGLRIRKMLDYVHGHFSEPVALADIAGTAGIGERECLRCFRRTIQISPMQYLLKYRVMQGADILLKNPSKSVSEAAACCGFDSASNFSKMFKRFYNCSPREYRRMHTGFCASAEGGACENLP